MNLNRAARRELEQAKKRARLESAEITAYCAWPTCRQPVSAVQQGGTVNGFEFAAAALEKHYEEDHGGRRPQPIEGNCVRCKRPSSWTPGTVLLMCEACKQVERIA